MKVAVVTEPYKVEIQELPKPEIKEHEVLIKTVYAGICGSDLHLYKGQHAFRKLPASLGHEIVGIVEKTGYEVKNIKAGDRVTVEPQIGCGVCEFCKSGHVNLCENKIVPGTPAWMGTFAEYFVAPEKTVYKLEPQISDKAGALTEPLAVAVQAMRTYEGAERGSIAILGCGTIGLLTLLLAKQYHFQKIYCTDTVAFNRELAEKMGADTSFDPLACDAAKEIKKLTDGKGVDVCIVAAGAPNIIDQASALTKKRGQVVLISMITKPIPVYTYGFVFKEQKLSGTMTYVSEAFEEAMKLINEGLDVSQVITHTLPIEETLKGLEILNTKSENAGKILICP